MFKPESLRKIVCIPAYIIVAICALICSINALSSSDKISMKLFFGDDNTSLRKTIVASILLLASLITLACAVSWMMMK
jgi:hypothetical protein